MEKEKIRKCEICGSTTRTLKQSKLIPSHKNVCGVCRMQEYDELQAEIIVDRMIQRGKEIDHIMIESGYFRF